MTESFAARVRADARLAMLQILASDLGYSLNHIILRAALDRLTAITLTEDEVKTHLGWLEDRELVTTEIVNRFTLAKLTDAGLSVARGSATVEGISRPSPGDMG